MLAAALWFVPAAQFTVMVADPLPLAVIVMVVPLTLTVATEVLLDVAEIALLPLLEAVTFPVEVPMPNLMLL